MLATYDEIMAWYEQRKAAGLTIESATLVERYKESAAMHPDMPAIPLCDSCRWHISGLWGSDYCASRPHCHECSRWTMYRADDYDDSEDNSPWKSYAERKKSLF